MSTAGKFPHALTMKKGTWTGGLAGLFHAAGRQRQWPVPRLECQVTGTAGKGRLAVIPAKRGHAVGQLGACGAGAWQPLNRTT